MASWPEPWTAKKKLATIRTVVIYKLEWYTEALQLIQKTQSPYKNRAILIGTLLVNILEQTNRIGRLPARFRSKSVSLRYLLTCLTGILQSGAECDAGDGGEGLTKIRRTNPFAA